MNISHARATVAGAIAAVALWGCVAMSAAPAELSAPAEVVVSTVPAVVETPAPVASADVIPAQVVAPVDVDPAVTDTLAVDTPEPVEALPAEDVATPAECGEGFAMAEDMSCVPVSFWDDTAVELPACESEDSTNCYWDARTRGNGLGRSFVDVAGVTYYFGS